MKHSYMLYSYATLRRATLSFRCSLPLGGNATRELQEPILVFLQLETF